MAMGMTTASTIVKISGDVDISGSVIETPSALEKTSNVPHRTRVQYSYSGAVGSGLQTIRTNTSGKVLYVTDLIVYPYDSIARYRIADDGTYIWAGGIFTNGSARSEHFTTPLRFENNFQVHHSEGGNVNLTITIIGWEESA